MKELFELRKGIIFKIWAEKEEGKYWGCWECPDCEESVGSSKACLTEGEALEIAKINASVHHGSAHGKRP
jgi:hypothetical protein